MILASGTLLIYLGEGYAGWRDAVRQSAAAGAVFAFVLCILLAPVIDASVTRSRAGLSDDQLSGAVSFHLFWTWLIAFIPLWIIAFGFAVRPRSRAFTQAGPPPLG